MGKIKNLNNITPVILAAGFGSRLGSDVLIPKCLLEIKKISLIEYLFNYLIIIGFKEVNIIVGYKKSKIKNKLLKYKDKIKINYIYNNKYRISGHGYSLFKFLETKKINKDILIIHGDLFFEKVIIDNILKSLFKDIVSVDRLFNIYTNDEIVVSGKENKVQSICKIGQVKNNIVGEIVGINKWSKAFQKKFLNFSKKLFKKEGIKYNWEPIINAMLKSNINLKLNYLDIKNNKWININYNDDYIYAKKISKFIKISK